MSNREIKFRAWDDINKEMVFQHVDGLQSVFNHDILKRFENIMQYSGVKDMNGVEIFEGDIVQYKHYHIYKKWWSTVSEIPEIEKGAEEGRKNFDLFKGDITFYDGCFRINGKAFGEFQIHSNVIKEFFDKGTTHSADFECKWWDFEVIGNVYQNSK